MDRNSGMLLSSLVPSTNINEHFLFAGPMPAVGMQDGNDNPEFVSQNGSNFLSIQGPICFF